jgi:Purine nucleoside phosphorylase
VPGKKENTKKQEAGKSYVGIIGGPEILELADYREKKEFDTEYGKPSSPLMLGSIAGVDIAAMRRDAIDGGLSPQNIPYLANIKAFESLGVKRIIAISSVATMRSDFVAGDFVFPSHFINMSNGRRDTFFDSGNVLRIGDPKPYCSDIAYWGAKAADNLGYIKYHKESTVIITNGTRRPTLAESRLFAGWGCDVIDYYQYPEIVLAKEKGICYGAVSMVLDYDSIVEELGKSFRAYVDMEGQYKRTISGLKALLSEMLPNIAEDKSCECKSTVYVKDTK